MPCLRISFEEIWELNNLFIHLFVIDLEQIFELVTLWFIIQYHPLVLGQLLFCVIYVFLLSPVSNCWSLPIILTELLNLHIFFICKMIITCICVVVLDLHRLSWIITYSFIILLLQINIQSISCNCCGISAIVSLIFINNGQPGFLQFTATTNKTIFPSLYINLYRSIWEYVFPCAF